MRAPNLGAGQWAHGLARLMYWLSLVLLLWGVRELIDPAHRGKGETFHIYITFVFFEAYIWGLLLLGRWQTRRGMTGDAARSGVFAAVLTGLIFVALNEFHTVSASEANGVTLVALALAVLRLLWTPRWLGLTVPAGLRVACGLWLVTLAGANPLLGPLQAFAGPQYAGAYALCWWTALLVGAHGWLAGRQASRGWSARPGAMGIWWAPWVLVGVLAASMVLQLYAALWSLDIDWAPWFFSPVYAAVGAVVVCLAHARRRGRSVAWLVMSAALLHLMLASGEPAPPALAEWSPAWASELWVHSTWPTVRMLSALGVLAAIWLGRAWPAVWAASGPAIEVVCRHIDHAQEWRHGRGAALLAGAFALLALGAALQRVQEVHKRSAPRLPDRADARPPIG